MVKLMPKMRERAMAGMKLSMLGPMMAIGEEVLSMDRVNFGINKISFNMMENGIVGSLTGMDKYIINGES